MAPVSSPIRWFVAFLFVALATGLFAYTVTSYLTLDLAQGFDALPYNELLKEAISGKKALSERMFQLGLLMLAALWGLVIAKRGEAGIVVSRNPEFVAFICASLVLLLSLTSHSLYVQVITSGFQDSAVSFSPEDQTIINVFDDKFEYFYRMQIINLIAGAAMAVTTLVSAHKINEKEV